MTPLLVADAAAVSAPVTLVLLLAVVVLLGARVACGVWQIALSRLVARLLDGSIVASVLLYGAMVIVRFRIIG